MPKKGKKPPPAEKRASKTDSRRPGRVERVLRAVVLTLFGLGVRLAFAGALALAAAVFFMYQALPNPEDLRDGRSRGSVTLLDSHGDVFAWRGEQFGGEIGVGDVSPHLIHAILATEDRRFYSHFGVDLRGLARAMLANIRAGRVVEGGSTITQQVAKNVFLTNERTFERKLKEIPMALAMELKYDKDDILAVYLNRVYLGAGTYGFEAASQRYFGKSARFVDPAEAAMLAGLLKAPSTFSPTADIDRAQSRAEVVVRAMLDQGYLTTGEAAMALAEPAQLSAAAAARAGGQFADWVMDTGPDYLTEATSEDVLIRTTFDARAQRAAEEALAKVFRDDVRKGSKAQAAIVVMTPDGAVRAIVGGRDDAAGQFNRATQAQRQPGSAFKPIVYAAALETGVSPDDVVVDAPLRIGNWSPTNYDGGYDGPMTVRYALAHSVNTVAVRLYERVGADKVAAMARKLGITTPIAPGPATALGASEATLLEMTGAYAAFASGGFDGSPWGIRDVRVRGDDTPLMTGPGTRRRVLAAPIAGYMTGMLADVVSSGTGRRAALPGRPVAGKTGTTQAARDAWFIGFSAQYVVGVWMGYDDNTPLTGVTGGGLPTQIWRETMLRLHEGLPVRPLPELEPSPRAPAIARSEEPGDVLAGGGGQIAGDDEESLIGGIVSNVMRALGVN